MFVNLPWKGGWHRVRDHQLDAIEYDKHGPFLRVLNQNTNRLNKCRVARTVSNGPKQSPKPSSPKTSLKQSPKTSSPKTSSKQIRTLHDLVGKRVHGTIRRTGSDFVALLVDGIDGFDGSAGDLVRMAQSYVKPLNPRWNVDTPRSWRFPTLDGGHVGPHVSLHLQHKADVGKRASLRIVDVMHWEEDSRWVALQLEGGLVDRHGWTLHMSCAQEAL